MELGSGLLPLVFEWMVIDVSDLPGYIYIIIILYVSYIIISGVMVALSFIHELIFL